MKSLRARRTLWLITAILVVALGAAALARDAIARTLLPVAGSFLGYEVRAERVEIGVRRLLLVAPDVRTKAGEPVFTADRIEAGLDLHDLLFKGRHLYGLTSVEIERPRLTVIEHRDGSYNVPLAGGKGNPGGAPAPALPDVALRIRDGSVLVISPFRFYAAARRIRLDGLNLDARLTPDRQSHYALGFALVVQGRSYPVSGRALLDPARGFESQHFTAAELPLGPLVNAALNTPKVNLASARLLGLDACLCGLADRSGTMQRHLSGTALLRDFKLYLGGLNKPVRDGQGRLYLYDDGVTAPKMSAAVAGIPLRVTGALYGLSAPTFRLGLTGEGPVSRLASVVNSGRYPVSGRLRLGLLIEGDAANPLVLARFDSASIGYGAYPLLRPAGAAALRGTDAEILRASARYGPLDATLEGSVTLGKHTDFELLSSLAAEPNGLPYASLVIPGMPLTATAVIAGTDAAAGASGIVAGSSRQQTLATLFRVDRTGVGRVGPLTLDGPGDASLYLRAQLDKPHDRYAVVAALQHVRVNSAGLGRSALPGLRLPPIPEVSGLVDARVIASSERHGGSLAGDLNASQVRLRGALLGELSLHGAGTADGRGAIEGRYRGSLEQIARVMPSGLHAQGELDVPFALARDDGRLLAQIDGARFRNASVAGASIRSLDATVGVRGRRYDTLDVYAARGELAGGTVLAAGSFGNGGTLQLSAAGIALAGLGSALPLTGGRLNAIATVDGSIRAPRVTAGVVLDDGRFRQLDIGASTLLAFANGRLEVRDGLVQAGPAVATLHGDASGLAGGNMRDAHYEFDARMRDADVASLASVARASLPYPAGTLDADLHVSGEGSAPFIAGLVALPEGSINGLPFRDASVRLRGSVSALHAQEGRVTVGTSRISFAGAVGARSGQLAMRAPWLDLADFNDYFDAGDTLGGTGSAVASVAFSSGSVASSGNVALAAARYRRFTLGDAHATWSTTGRSIHAVARVAGQAGNLSARGFVTLAATEPYRDPLHRTTVDLNAQAQRIDLNTWLPAAGLHAPIEGYVDATASVRGTYPNVDIVTTASLAQGLLGRIPIRRLQVAANAARGRATITSAILEIPELSASAGGTFGLQPRDPFDVTVHADSPDIGALAQVVSGKKLAVSGALETTARASGTAARPQLAALFQLTRLAYDGYTVPSVRADATYQQSQFALHSLVVDLQQGRVTAQGAIPLRPPATASAPSATSLVPANAPVALAVSAQGVELGQFAPLLPTGTKLAGAIDGRLTLGGTVSSPVLDGTLSLARLAYSGPQERSPITGGVAELVFSGTSAELRDASARVGGGTVSAQGTVRVADLRDPSQAALDFQASASNAVLDLPQYFKGRVNGSLTVKRVAGAVPVVDGQVAFDSTRIPLSAVFNPNAPAGSSGPKLPDVALNLGVTVGRDVRVQSGNVDVGAQGSLQAGGTIAAPKLTGRLESTGGSLDFYRDFQIQSGSLVFETDNGLIPTIHAVATTQIPDPPTFVTLTVTGLADHLNVALESDAGYSREQILGLLVGAQALGAVNGVATSGGAQTNLVQSVAAGELGTLLTRNLLEPFSTQIGSTLGLQNLAIGYTPGQGGLGLNASKKLFRDVNAVYAQTFNYPQRQSLGVRVSPSNSTAIQLIFFTQPGSGEFVSAPTSLTSNNLAVTSGEPENGTSGYSLTLQRRFW